MLLLYNKNIATGHNSQSVKALLPLTTEIDNQGTGVTMEDYHSNTNDPPVAPQVHANKTNVGLTDIAHKCVWCNIDNLDIFK